MYIYLSPPFLFRVDAEPSVEVDDAALPPQRLQERLRLLSRSVRRGEHHRGAVGEHRTRRLDGVSNVFEDDAGGAPTEPPRHIETPPLPPPRRLRHPPPPLGSVTRPWRFGTRAAALSKGAPSSGSER